MSKEHKYEKSLLEKCKDSIAQKEGYDDWTECRYKESATSMFLLYDQVCELYARECCQATLEKAAGNAKHITEPPYTLDLSSITNKDNIVIL